MNETADKGSQIAALLPSVYEELRRIAAASMARMPPGCIQKTTNDCWRSAPRRTS